MVSTCSSSTSARAAHHAAGRRRRSPRSPADAAAETIAASRPLRTGLPCRRRRRSTPARRRPQRPRRALRVPGCGRRRRPVRTVPLRRRR
ncbi:hypothetical protein DMP14_00155 [Pseudonocardia sp. Ae707_Ps2]